MRIISQSKMDIPYDTALIYVDDSCIICKSLICPNAKCMLGTYKSNERAVEVFNEIHKRYARLDESSMFFVMPEE